MYKIKPFVLIILDGWGTSPAWGGNTLSFAKTPNFNRYISYYPRTQLQASGEAVGLPGQEMGNSEVGHLNIGAGRVIRQDVSKVSESITNGDFFNNKVLKLAAQHAKKNHSAFHIAGLVSNGGVHSHIDHLFALIDFAANEHLNPVYIHIFTDGRDTSPTSALSFISRLKDKLKTSGIGKIASMTGRYYAMDRDKRWDRTQSAYDAITNGKGISSEDPLAAISLSYAEGITDEFIKPTVFFENNKIIGTVQKNDALVFFNFRSDRMRQLLYAFCKPGFQDFIVKQIPNLFLVTMVPYDYELIKYTNIIFPIPREVKNCLAQVLSMYGIKQLHIAETEKYAHVTYFLNGGREEPFPGEGRIMVPSPRVPTYDIQPEMSAYEITQKITENIDNYDFFIINFANPDMVGHTGNKEATVTALETVDKCVGKIVNIVQNRKGLVIITADHGNSEQILDPVTSEPDTEHSTNPVPFILIDGGRKFKNLHPGKLSNIAPTILDILEIPIPNEMTEKSLFENVVVNQFV